MNKIVLIALLLALATSLKLAHQQEEGFGSETIGEADQ